ncbi:MAG: aminopeptidase P family protein [Christensenellales bacterium]|jgi:Xaa-Pro aminopeptidase
MKPEILALQSKMAERRIDLYMVPTSDFHDSEYVSPHFSARRWLSGFTGSAGTLLVTRDSAFLWTDGRYFIQAEKELAGSGIALMRMGEPDVPTVYEFVERNLPKNGVLAFDGRLVSEADRERYAQIAEKNGGSVVTSFDLAGEIWKDRPALPCSPAFSLPLRFCGRSRMDKISSLQKEIQKHGATAHLITTLDDIAWLFNIRGNDIAYTPVVLAYALITMDEAQLFIQPKAVSQELGEELAKDGVTVLPYESIYQALSELPEGTRLLLDKRRVQCAAVDACKEGVSLVHAPNPTTLMKAIKNETEIESLRASHIRDGLAVTRFMKWLKESVERGEKLDELSAAQELQTLRQAGENYIEPSFSTICAYGKNAAMMHYSATEQDYAEIQPEGFLLVDSGAQYLDGTTDVTRTFVLGPITKEQRVHFTAVVRGMLNLQSAKFLKGCKGLNLDILARGPIWDLGIDYRCGTGHGVGFVLGVHEAPNGIRWRVVPERDDSATLLPGMVTTDEPGIYVEDSHGIRIENELLCVSDGENEYGEFLRFEPLTFVPIDLDGIDPALISKPERHRLNEYHALVYSTLSPLMTDEDRQWLEDATRPI